MTREEAIDYNKNLKMYMKISDKNNPCKFLEKNYIALDMAIEALKEMSVEEYRQRLMDAFIRTDHSELLTYVVMPKEEEFKSLEDILRQYKFEPRLHGTWVDVPKYKGFYVCSKCLERLNGDFTRFDHWEMKKDNFCSVCGSDNRKVDEAE